MSSPYQNGQPADMDGLDVLVRFHDPSTQSELRQAVFSLVCADYRPLRIHIITQRFTSAQVEHVVKELEPTVAIDDSVALQVLNYSRDLPIDARAALLNHGIFKTRSRYVAMLDYDDVILPDAYLHLTGLLKGSQASVAFGKIAVKYKSVFEDAIITTNRIFLYGGKALQDLFRENFCPLHSFVIDRLRIQKEDLFFEQQLCRLEDYDFLIRTAAKYDFVFSDQVVGDYYHKNDGTNSSLFSPNPSAENIVAWDEARHFVEKRRCSTTLSDNVQATLGIWPPLPNLTVRAFLDGTTGRV